MEPERKLLWVCGHCKRQKKPKTSTPILKTNTKKQAPITGPSKHNTESGNKSDNTKQQTNIKNQSKQSVENDITLANNRHLKKASLTSNESQEKNVLVTVATDTGTQAQIILPILTSQKSPITSPKPISNNSPIHNESPIIEDPIQRQPLPPDMPQLSPPALDESVFVTQRRKRNFHNVSMVNINSLDSSLSGSEAGSLANKSLPDLSTLQTQELQIMKNEIQDLKLKLQAAENEMDNLMLENRSMAQQIKKQDQKIKHLLTICTTTNKNDSKRKPNDKRTKAKDRKHELYHSFHTQNMDKTSANVMKDTFHEKESIREEATNLPVTITRPGKRKVFVVADQQGRGLQQVLQHLLGERYCVTCFWKDGANLQEILNTCKTELSSLNLNDFIVVVGGTNDNNPLNLKISLLKWLSVNCHTNIIICGLSCSANLRISLNKEIELICKGFSHSTFVELNYGRANINSKYFLSNLCFSITRDITHVIHRDYSQIAINSHYREEVKNKESYYSQVPESQESANELPQTPHTQLHRTAPFL